jgi:endonuclease/exonuclease/phosphatase (EEP) superfamily protein YafD
VIIRQMYRFLRIALILVAVALCVFTVMPVVNTSAWWVRIFDFPRVQIAAAMGVALVAWVVVYVLDHRRKQSEVGTAGRGKGWRWTAAVVPVLLLAGLFWQGYRIFPYTPLAAHQVENARGDEHAETLRLLIYNVRYDNGQTDELLETIDKTDPDLILLVEPTHWWEDRLSPRLPDYSHNVLQPQENHYGILLYSRLELVNSRVRFLVDDEVPSIRTDLRMPAGRIVTFHGVHPKPPGMKREADPERVDSDQRDAELLVVAREVAEAVKQGGDQPVIVAGDFNDVAWSHTTRLFQRVSGLLDPRVGRGLFNTYHAQSRVHRFPLDHVFTSNHFRLISLEVLPPLGSDHHAVLVALALQRSAPATQEEPTQSAEDEEEADEIIDDAREAVDTEKQDGT